MAHMHSKKRGKSSSERPVARSVPQWVEYSPQEVEELVLKIAKEGNSSAAIGAVLRDTYGVPSVRNVTGKRVQQILAAHGVVPEYPDDLLKLIKRAVSVRGHLKENKRDVRNGVKLVHVESKIKRLVDYYRREGRLPARWSYDPETAALLVK